MSHKSSVHGLFINATGWTGKANPVTAGNEALHTELARTDVLLMRGGLMAKRLGLRGSLTNPYPRGHRTSPRAIQNMRFGLLDEISGEME